MPYWWLTTVNPSVGPSTTYPLTHGASATYGVVVTLRNDTTPVIREPPMNHPLPQYIDNDPVIREPLINQPLPQTASYTLPQRSDNYPINWEPLNQTASATKYQYASAIYGRYREPSSLLHVRTS